MTKKRPPAFFCHPQDSAPTAGTFGSYGHIRQAAAVFRRFCIFYKKKAFFVTKDKLPADNGLRAYTDAKEQNKQRTVNDSLKIPIDSQIFP